MLAAPSKQRPFYSTKSNFSGLSLVHCKILSNHVIPVSAIVSRQRLRSAQQNTLAVQRYRLTTYGRRVFSVAGGTVFLSHLGT